MRIVFMFLAFVVLLGACKGSQPADTTDVLVSVKGRTLNRSEVNKLIPRGISSADSLLLAESFTYILQMPSLYFDVEVEPLSYVLAVVLSFGFTFIVNLATNRTLNKIDMVGALKSAE